LTSLSDGVTGRYVVEGLPAPRSGRGRDPDPAPRSDLGRDIDIVSLCTRRGRYKSLRRNNTGGDADPTTDNSLQLCDIYTWPVKYLHQTTIYTTV